MNGIIGHILVCISQIIPSPIVSLRCGTTKKTGPRTLFDFYFHTQYTVMWPMVMEVPQLPHIWMWVHLNWYMQWHIYFERSVHNPSFTLKNILIFLLYWNCFKNKAWLKGASALRTTHRFTDQNWTRDWPVSVLSAPHSCVRFGAISTEPLGWSSGAIELIYCPKRHWPALASPRLHLFSTAPHVNSRPHIYKCNENCKQWINAHPKFPQKLLYPWFVSKCEKVANFWQIQASEGDARGSQRAVSGNPRNLAVPRSNRPPSQEMSDLIQACTSFYGTWG